ncbi:MAG: hypothetical protein M0027_07485 [Candidatus Dormibacteraeota bacterium]|nr:hypothetical protein [Candidatus Dormibacteraeota bacterium]
MRYTNTVDVSLDVVGEGLGSSLAPAEGATDGDGRGGLPPQAVVPAITPRTIANVVTGGSSRRSPVGQSHRLAASAPFHGFASTGLWSGRRGRAVPLGPPAALPSVAPMLHPSDSHQQRNLTLPLSARDDIPASVLPRGVAADPTHPR